MEWLVALVAKGVFAAFGDTIVKPLLQAFLKSKDVDLEKFKSSEVSTEQLATAVLSANVEFAKVKSAYALSILQWWPFRVILFALLFFPAGHFSMVVIDSSVVWFFEGRYGIFKVPAVPEKYLDIEWQLLLFFVIAQPVDRAVTGAVAAVASYLNKR
jgi:hypothetical protein